MHVCDRDKSLPKSERISGSGNQPKPIGGASPAKKTPPRKNAEMAEVVYERHVNHENDGLETKGDASLASRGPEAQNIGAQISKRGRPRIGEQRGKPWLSSVPPMSERTYRRRLSEQRRKKEQEK